MSTDSSVAIVFYYSFALLITSIIFFPDNFIMPNGIQIILAMSLGVMGSLGHLFMSQAAKYADVAITSPFEYSSFIFVGLMGYLIYSEVPTLSPNCEIVEAILCKVTFVAESPVPSWSIVIPAAVSTSVSFW